MLGRTTPKYCPARCWGACLTDESELRNRRGQSAVCLPSRSRDTAYRIARTHPGHHSHVQRLPRHEGRGAFLPIPQTKGVYRVAMEMAVRGSSASRTHGDRGMLSADARIDPPWRLVARAESHSLDQQSHGGFGRPGRLGHGDSGTDRYAELFRARCRRCLLWPRRGGATHVRGPAAVPSIGNCWDCADCRSADCSCGGAFAVPSGAHRSCFPPVVPHCGDVGGRGPGGRFCFGEGTSRGHSTASTSAPRHLVAVWPRRRIQRLEGPGNALGWKRCRVGP